MTTLPKDPVMLLSFTNMQLRDNYSSLDGTGYSFNLGVIARPTDFLRLGVAYNSPTWYKMTNYYSAEAGAYVFDYYLGEPALSYYLEDDNEHLMFDTGYSDSFINP